MPHYYSTMMSFYRIKSREGAKCEAVIHCSVVFTTGRIPADEGAIMAELNDPGDEPNFDLFGSIGIDFFSDDELLLTETDLTEQTETTEQTEQQKHFVHC